MKFDNSKINFISIIFLLILHTKIFNCAKMKIPGNITAINPKAKSTLNIKKNLEIESLYKKNYISQLNSDTKSEANSYNFIEGPNFFLKENTELEKVPLAQYIEKYKKEMLKADYILDNKQTKNKESSYSNSNNMQIEDNLNLQLNNNNDLLVRLKDIENIVTNKLIKKKLTQNQNSQNIQNSPNSQSQLSEEIINIKNHIKDKYKKYKKENDLNDSYINNKKVIGLSEELLTEYFEKILINDFDLFSENFERRKYLEDHNVFVFYNSLSLIILSMLGGGVLGLLFILFFSFKEEDHKIII